MISRINVYLATAAAVTLLLVGLTILVTGVLTTSEVGPTVITGTATTTGGALATLTTGYRAAHHYAIQRTNHRAADLVRDIVTHDAHLAPDQPRATIVQLDDAQTRRMSREPTT